MNDHSGINRMGKCRSAPYLIGVSFRTHHGLTIHVVLRFVVQNTKTTHARVSACVCAVFTSLVSPVFGDDYFVDGAKDVHFEFAIAFGGGGEGRGCIDFDEPGFAVIVDEHIKAVELEAVLVVDDHALHALERHYDDVIYVFKTTACLFCPIHHLQIKLQVFGRPLAPVVPAVLLAVFLDGHVGEVHEHVVHLGDV